jgi:hypothetical protein
MSFYDTDLQDAPEISPYDFANIIDSLFDDAGVAVLLGNKPIVSPSLPGTGARRDILRDEIDKYEFSVSTTEMLSLIAEDDQAIEILEKELHLLS